MIVQGTEWGYFHSDSPTRKESLLQFITNEKSISNLRNLAKTKRQSTVTKKYSQKCANLKRKAVI